MPKSNTESTKRPKETKTRQELEQETGTALGNQEYLDIITATQNMPTVYGASLKDIENPGIGLQHEGLTRMLSWGKRLKTLLKIAKSKNKHRQPNKGL